MPKRKLSLPAGYNYHRLGDFFKKISSPHFFQNVTSSEEKPLLSAFSSPYSDKEKSIIPVSTLTPQEETPNTLELSEEESDASPRVSFTLLPFEVPASLESQKDSSSEEASHILNRLQETENETPPPKSFKRLRFSEKKQKLSDEEKSLPLSFGSQFIKISDSDSEESDDNNISELQLKQMKDNDWLERVVEKLESLSNIPQHYESLSLEQKFLMLKEQWAYTGKYKQVDPEQENCKLCGHDHIATSFKILNLFNQRKTFTGSRCITQFKAIQDGNLLNEKESRKIISQNITTAEESRRDYRKGMEKFLKRR